MVADEDAKWCPNVAPRHWHFKVTRCRERYEAKAYTKCKNRVRPSF